MPRRILVTLGIAAAAIAAPALAFADVGGQVTPVGGPIVQVIGGQCELIAGGTTTVEPFGAPVPLSGGQTAVCLRTPEGSPYVTAYVPPAPPAPAPVPPVTTPPPVATVPTTTVPAGTCTP